AAAAKGEGYGTSLVNEPERVETSAGGLPHPLLAVAPLLLVGVANFVFTRMIPVWYGGDSHTVPPEILPGIATAVTTTIKTVTAIWAVQAALLLGILFVVATAFTRVARRFADGSKAAVGGALLAA
ncbi:MAG TPA: transporter, partial [Massilia timonae]|nr:transporter [Massilia timonae]